MHGAPCEVQPTLLLKRFFSLCTLEKILFSCASQSIALADLRKWPIFFSLETPPNPWTLCNIFHSRFLPSLEL